MEQTFSAAELPVRFVEPLRDEWSPPGEGKAIFKASLVFHLVVIVFGVVWMLLDSRPSEPTPVALVELVNVGATAPPRSAPKQIAEPTPPTPPSPPEVKRELPQEVPAPPSPPVPTPAPVKPVKPAPHPEPAPVQPHPAKPTSVAEPVAVAAAAAASAPVDSLPASNEMALPTFAKRSASAAPAAAAAGVIGQTGDPRVNVYNGQIRAAVEPRWRPPVINSVSAGVRAVVSFSINRSGVQESVRLEQSSGSDVLDQLALRAVSLARFPPLPAAITEDPYPVKYGFVYEGG